MTTLAVSCLLGTASTSALAQETPRTGDDSVDRVEVPGHGFEVALPEGWTAEWMEHPSGATSGLVLTASGPEQHCLATAGSLDGVPFHDVAGLIPGFNEAKEDTFAVDGPIAVDLPSGPGVLFDVEQGPEPLSPAAQYLIDGGDRFLSINCVGHARPDDDWRSVAEAFAWTPLRHSHADAGVAIRWPHGWSVSEYDDPADWGGLIFGTIGGDTVCTLTDEGLFGGQDGFSLDAVVEAWRKRQPFGEPRVADGIHPSVERAVRLDSTDRSVYFFVAGETVIGLSCQAMPPSPEPPADRWFSIAESFEFLPAEE